jgi:hypothetical protein
MNKSESDMIIDMPMGIQELLVRIRKRHLVAIRLLQEKIEYSERELEVFRVQLDRENTYINELNAEISRLEKKLPPNQVVKA